jgi:hypothetical protein
VFLATAASAQQLSLPGPPVTSTVYVEPLTPEQEREIDAWLAAMDVWRRDEAKWNNRPKRDGWGRIAARRPRPDAPSWLAAYCDSAAAAGINDLPERSVKACRLHDEPRAAISSTGTQAPAAPIDAEKPPKHSTFLTRVHLDGLWTTTSTQGRAYGLVGSHVSLVDVGRLQIFGPPGVLLLSVPDVDGSRRVTLGYTWGVSLRLVDVRLFDQKDMTLFLNVSKVWIGGGGQGLDIVGFSLAPRRKR